MFSSLSDRLQGVLRRLRGRGRLTEADVNQALREVRLALLEADVNFRVVKDFIDRLRERAVGEEVLGSLTPGQQVIKIVHDELADLMGGGQAKLASGGSPTVIMLAGLQGSGKTTSAAKLAMHLQREGRRPLLVAADTRRPAAVDQLQQLASRIQVPVFTPMDTGAAPGEPVDPIPVAAAAIPHAVKSGRDTVIIDTAGRLHVDDELMAELQGIFQQVKPHEVLLVIDAMTGQEAVAVAESFHGALQLTGLILTKLDGDTRGGAALSVRAVTGCPIKFAGTGEKMEALEPFHPERMASRILGMGDVLTLVERAQREVDTQEAQRIAQRLQEDKYDLEDFMGQLQQMRKMGPMDQILSLLPGMGPMKQVRDLQIDESQLNRVEAIIQSMTPAERRDPSIINSSRRKRIARGSGTTVQDVNRLLKQFNETKQLVRQLTGGGGAGGPGRKSAKEGKRAKGAKGSKKGKGAKGTKGFPRLPGLPFKF